MGDETVQKICVSCGKDVRGLKRTKDPRGRYWCADCYRRAVEKQRAPRAAGCPRCGSALAPGAVLCTNCGYDLRSGGRHETDTSGPTKAEVAREVITDAAIAGATGTAVMVGGLVGAAIGGAIGAALWAGVAMWLRLELSWIAIVVGLLVGVGTRIGARGRTSLATGGLAALLAVAAIAGGKYAALSIEFDQLTTRAVNDNLAVDLIAGQMQAEEGDRYAGAWFRRRGFAFSWPKMSWEEAQREASAFWYDELTDADRAAALEMLKVEMKAFAQDAEAIKREGLIESLHPFDAAFALVAVIVAFGAGRGAPFGNGDD
jgi:DNA-directed RNA polymerase subunit RPC12/RpoP